jgi:hypothetical protein
MSSASVACPYCNAPVPVAPGIGVGQRLSCPRCGESFVWKSSQNAGDADTEPPVPAASPSATSPPPSPPRLANWQVAAAILGGMALMAAISAVFMLSTRGTRQTQHFWLPQFKVNPSLRAFFLLVGLALAWLAFSRLLRPGPAEQAGGRARPWQAWRILVAVLGGVALVAGVWVLPDMITDRYDPTPSETPLAYLPRGANVILAVDLAALRQTAGGRDVLTQSWKIGPARLSLADLKGWTGLNADEVDQVVLALVVPADVGKTLRLPAVVLIVRSRAAVVPADVLQALDSSLDRGVRVEKRGGEGERKILFPVTVRLPKPMDRPFLWFADRQTLVLSFLEDDELRRVDRREDLGQLPGTVRAAVQARQSRSPLWAVVQLNDASLLGLLARQRWSGLPGDLGERLVGLNLISAGVEFGEGAEIVLRAELNCQDGRQAEALVADMALVDGLEVRRDDRRVSVTWKTSRDALERLLTK